ncbi:GNAT family N-acetyltransferase [Chloroflexia bacterium SDU3-3]|nr:GNAT family N-acetyltransferase [Chloroflexia bacterium SDU3-3]
MLQGPRVTLRPTEKDDMEALHALARNVELVQLTGFSWRPESLARWQREFEQHAEDPTEDLFTIVADGLVIGFCTLHQRNRRDSATQLGIGIYHPGYVGHGYGREAIGLLLDWAFYDQGWRRVWLRAISVNERALKAYRKIGFVEEGRLRQQAFFQGQYVDIITMGMLREEWDAIRSS